MAAQVVHPDISNLTVYVDSGYMFYTECPNHVTHEHMSIYKLKQYECILDVV